MSTERILLSVLDASSTTPCTASSQLLGDSDNTSMTLTILAMVIILLPIFIADGRGIARFVESLFSVGVPPPIAAYCLRNAIEMMHSNDEKLKRWSINS